MTRRLESREKPLKMGKGKLVVERPAVISNIRFRGSLNTVGAFSYGNVDVLVHLTDIGRYCSIGHEALIAPVEHPVDWFSTHGFAFSDKGTLGRLPEFDEIVSSEGGWNRNARTTIGNDVWIGARAFIKRGVSIGNGAVIAAQATVTRSVPPYAIVAGTPARVLRYRFDEKTIERLLALRWWEYSLRRNDVGNIRYSDVDASINAISSAIESGRLPLLEPEKIEFVNGVRAKAWRWF